MSSPECEDVADRVRLGLLWLESDLAPDAVVLLGAAQSAIARLDLELTERLADAAARAGAGSEANVLRGHALILLNRGAEAERILESLSPDELPPGTAGEVLHLRAANLLWPLGRPEDSWAVIEQALDRSAGGLVHQLRAFRAVQLAMAARPEDAMALMQSIDRSELGVKHAVVAIWAEVIALGDIGCARAAADAAAKGYELACGSSEATYQGAGLTDFHVSAMLVAGCIPAAVAAAERTFEMCENVPGSSRSVATAVVGMAALGSGDLRTATRRLDSAIADLQARGDTTGVRHRFMITHTEVLARSGRAELATEALARMRASQHPSLTYVESERLLSAAWVAAVRGRVTQARELARQAADFARSRGQLGREVLCLQTAVQFGDVTVVDRLVELAGLVDGPRAAVAARYARAVTDADPDGMTTACCDFEAMGDLCAAADAAAQASVAYARDHRRGAALTTSASANRLAERCGSASPALLAAESPLSLTDREREIVGLVAQGLSNKEIAAAISTSVRTVEGHIYRVMSRSGVGRTELSVLMRHQDGVPAAPHR
jgi:DNA-binding CsgD family transcriptional regulator